MRAEISVTEEAGKGTQKYATFGDQVVNYINSLYNKIRYKPEEDLQKIKKVKEKIEKCFEENKNTSDRYFVKNYQDLYNATENIEQEVLSLKKDSNANYSSGEGFYSLLKIAKNFLISFHEIKKNENNERLYLLLDEPEKFLHPTLIKRVVKILWELFIETNTSIVYTTHSPIFLRLMMEEWKRYKNLEQKDNTSSNIKVYKFYWNKEPTEILSLEDEILKQNFFFIELLCFCLLAENIFLVEGFKDYEFVSLLMNNCFENNYYYVARCEGKSNIMKIYKILEKSLKINKCFLFFDKDFGEANVNKGKEREREREISENYKRHLEENGAYFYEFDPNIENAINDANTKEKANLKSITWEKIEKMPTLLDIKLKVKKYLTRQEKPSVLSKKNKQSELKIFIRREIWLH